MSALYDALCDLAAASDERNAAFVDQEFFDARRNDMSPQDYGIPDYMVGGLMRYIQHGIDPGSFLSAVLCNDLKEAVAQADDTNRFCIQAYVTYLYSQAPAACWGSPAKVAAWIKQHEEARQAKAQGSKA